MVTTQRRGSYLTAGDRQRLSSALAVTYRQRTGDNIANHDGNLTPLERAALDLLDKAG